MIVHASQARLVELVEEALRQLSRHGAEPVAVRGARVSFYWPPRPAGLPLWLLRRMPRDVYVVFDFRRGKKEVIIVP
ncbi:MAG: hypothetical protein LM577_07310 [Thermoproteaceae archaeon]|nr:hypothetical protein [Thermoproteaceae archaeon]